MTSVITSDFIVKCTEDFKKADRNGDGFLDFKEFKDGSGHNPIKVMKMWKLFKKFDKDGNGKMDVDEYIVMEASMKGAGKEEVDEDLVEFLMIDKDHNGYISLEEFRQHCLEADPELARNEEKFMKSFGAIDVNGDGKIDYAEYKRICDAGRAGEGGKEEDEIRVGFLAIDEDRDGYISPEEYFNFSVKTNPALANNKDQLMGAFKVMDLNGDGRIEYKEFRSFVLAKRMATDEDGAIDPIRLQFHLIDEAKKGYLTGDELYTYFYAHNPSFFGTKENFNVTFKLFDADGNGRFDYEEFKRMDNCISQSIVDGRFDANRFNFLTVDADGDGFISFTEYSRLMEVLGFTSKEDKRRTAMAFLAICRGGELRANYEQFLKLTGSN